MKAREIKTAGFYVNESRGLVREIMNVRDDGYVEYHSYWLADGVSDGILGICQKQTLAQWASRVATDDEVSRLKRLEAKQRRDDRERELLAMVSEAMPTRADDDLLASHFPGGFTIRDEANALVAWAFRNGPLEDLHAGKRSALLDDLALSRITDEEMQVLMKSACRQLTKLLQLKATHPAEYERQIKSYNWRYCRAWER